MRVSITLGILTISFVFGYWGYVVSAPSTLIDGTSGTILVVDCDDGTAMTLGYALQTAPSESTILITGTCQEAVTVTTDGLTIEGQNPTTAIINGQGGDEAAMTINGARRLTIKNLTVENGHDGIHVTAGASITLNHVTVRNNIDDGLDIENNSTANLINVSALNNGDNGIGIYRNSSATLCGTIMSNNNVDDGIVLFMNAGVQFGGGIAHLCDQSTIQTNMNGDVGINITTTSSAFFHPTTMLQSNDNVDDGLRVAHTSTLFFQGSTIEAKNNMDTGITVWGPSRFITLDVNSVIVTGNTNLDINVTTQSVASFNNTTFNTCFVSTEATVSAISCL